jgi:hypothetical protein
VSCGTSLCPLTSPWICSERVGRRAFDCTVVPIQMLKHTSATSSMSNKGLFLLGNMGTFMLVEQKILVLQRLFSREYGAHTRLFVWGRSLVNTLGTTANPYCYGARSWSLSRAPPPAIHGCHQCAAQPKSCIIHCQPCPSRLCCTAVANVQGASMSQGLHGLYGNHRLSLTQRDRESWADRLFTSTS